VSRRVAALAVLLSACGGAARKETTPPPAPTTFTPAQIAERALPSIVLIQTPVMLGTGFVVWKDGRIATNLHVLAGASEAKVILNDKREFTQIEVLGVDPAHDLAVIRIRAEGLVPLQLGDSEAVKPGERVVAIGHPLGLGNTISDGIVSGIRALDPNVTLLQITAPIAQGSSGGPIFNEQGEVIAVATLFASEGQNLNFGVPVSYLKPLLLGERPLSLRAFQQQVDLSLLEGCEVEDVKLAITEIADALKVGVPLFNNGDHQGCFEAYERSALKIVGSLKACRGVRETLLGGVSAANRAGTPTQKAWAIRHAFDRVMAAFDAAVKQVEQRR
jgi:serine protease Do